MISRRIFVANSQRNVSQLMGTINNQILRVRGLSHAKGSFLFLLDKSAPISIQFNMTAQVIIEMGSL